MIIFIIYKTTEITEWIELHKRIQLSCLPISMKRWTMAKSFTREEDVLVNWPPKALNLRIMQNWDMSEDESIRDPFYLFNAFSLFPPSSTVQHTQLPAMLQPSSPLTGRGWPRADPELCGSREMQISQAPGREAFCIYLLSLLGTSPPASEACAPPWIFSDKSLRNPLQGSLLHPCPKSGLD